MTWEIFAHFTTAIGVCVAAWQIWKTKRIAQTSFEDELEQQYRNLVRRIPVDALIGKPLSNTNSKIREDIFNYLDLCNEQIYLRRTGRIAKNRWTVWNEGIQENLSKDEFKKAWDEIQINSIKKNTPNPFTGLETLAKAKFKIDPKKWK